MGNLSSTELRILNNLSFMHDRTVALGTLLNSVNEPALGTAVNAVAATGVLTLTGAVIHGESFSLDNPSIAGLDRYQFAADEAQTVTLPGAFAVDITEYADKAAQTLTILAQPTAGDKMVIGTKVYTFVPAGTANFDGEISVGADLATAQAAIVAAINGTDGHNLAHTLVSASAFAANVSTITAFIGGTAGNSVATTETFTNAGNVFGDVTLLLGTDCSAANAVTAIVAAVTAHDSQLVTAADGTGDTVDFEASVAGAAGNAILVAEAMANASFGVDVTSLSGGVNGTVGVAGALLVDETYLYVAIADNTVSHANWRRISLGNVF